MPTTFGLYWFLSCYILIYVFSPFIKETMEKFEKKNIKRMLLIMVFVWGFVSMIPKTRTFFNEFIWLVTIYFIGAYIKKYGINFIKKKQTNQVYIVGLICFLIIFMIITEIISLKIPLLKKFIRILNSIQSPIILTLTILIFNIFKDLRVESNIINTIAKSTLGIYLIHDNVFLRDIIWVKIVNGNKYVESPILIMNALIGIVECFIISSIIELFVNKIIQKNIMRLLENIYNKVSRKRNFIKIENKIKKIIL